MRKLASTPKTQSLKSRNALFLGGIYLALFVILARLFYWQVIQNDSLGAAAEEQYQRSILSQGKRGSLLTAEGYPLVTNQQVYRLFAEPHRLTREPATIARELAPLLAADTREYQSASDSAVQQEIIDNWEAQISDKLSQPQLKWVSLKAQINGTTKQAVDQLDIDGLGFDPYYIRMYPEASMAAHLTGFVGKDSEGQDVGYFGLEGALEKELQARVDQNTIITDALGRQLLGAGNSQAQIYDGRNISLTIRRDIQHTLETELQKGMERYGGASGEIIVMDPKTGKILGLATWPTYDQATFNDFEPSLYKNPSLTSLYEPGSTFKVLTVAAGIDAGKIKPDTTCPNCEGPRVFGQYTIRTWNNEYHPDISMTDALAKSDNVAMIHIAEQLGADQLQEYLTNFGIGERLYLDLQEDRDTPFPSKWGPVELATVSFGQGITTNSLQMLRAIASIANDGMLMRPLIVDKVADPRTGQVITSAVQEERRVVSSETAQTVTEMMIKSAEYGEAQWTASRTHTVAGKTGTSQVVAEGKYLEDKTIASFVGFVPAHDPQFVMIVKINEPESSPWAAETAAPLWYRVAQKLYLLLNIPADKK